MSALQQQSQWKFLSVWHLSLTFWTSCCAKKFLQSMYTLYIVYISSHFYIFPYIYVAFLLIFTYFASVTKHSSYLMLSEACQLQCFQNVAAVAVWRWRIFLSGLWTLSFADAWFSLLSIPSPVLLKLETGWPCHSAPAHSPACWPITYLTKPQSFLNLHRRVFVAKM